MGLFSRIRGSLTLPPEPDGLVMEITAAELQAGMIFVAMPQGWAEVRPNDDGDWPMITEDPEYVEDGEGGVPCVYWLSDEPSPHNGYWCYPDTPITVAAASDEDEA